MQWDSFTRLDQALVLQSDITRLTLSREALIILGMFVDLLRVGTIARLIT